MAYQIPNLYQASVELINSTGDYLFCILSPSLVFVWLFVLSASFRGAGDTRTPMVITTLGMWLVRLPLAYVIIKYFGWGLNTFKRRVIEEVPTEGVAIEEKKYSLNYLLWYY